MNKALATELKRLEKASLMDLYKVLNSIDQLPSHLQSIVSTKVRECLNKRIGYKNG